MKRATLVWAALTASLAALLAGCQERPLVVIAEVYPVETLSMVRVLVEDGSVTIAEGRPGRIVVTGEYPQDVHEYLGTVAAAEARIELRQKRGLRFALGQRGAHLEVVAPPGATVEVETSNGAVEVTGAFRVEHVKASNGAVTVTGANGPLTIESSNARTRVEGHSGELVIQGSNGAIDVVEQRAGLLTLVTSNGAIRYQGTIEASGEAAGGASGENLLETSNAAIEVIVAGTPAFTLDAATSNGGITSRFALLDSVTAESRLSGRVGSGEARLVVRTSNGAIEVR